MSFIHSAEDDYEFHVLIQNEQDRPEVYITVARNDRQLQNMTSALVRETDEMKIADMVPDLEGGLPAEKMLVMLFFNNTPWRAALNDLVYAPGDGSLSLSLLRGESVTHNIYALFLPAQEGRLQIVPEFHAPLSNAPVAPNTLIYGGNMPKGLIN
jgi:hypothetical protein